VKLGDFAYARDCFERSLAAGVALQNPTSIGRASPLLAGVCFKQGDYAASKTHYATCLQVREHLEDWFVGLVLVNLGYEEGCLGHTEKSLASFQEGNALLERADEAYGLVVGWVNRTRIARMQGDIAVARDCLEQAQAYLPKTPARHLRASIQTEMAFLQAQYGNHELAQRTLQAAMTTFDELGYLSNVIEAADLWSALLAIAGQSEAAIRVNAAVTASREKLGIVCAPLEQKWLAGLLTTCSQTLQTDVIAQAQERGRALGLAALVNLINATTSTPSSPHPP
jgi:tetratricopeptide (TPR) repeat protein